jgi:hypothetical protein
MSQWNQNNQFIPPQYQGFFNQGGGQGGQGGWGMPSSANLWAQSMLSPQGYDSSSHPYAGAFYNTISGDPIMWGPGMGNQLEEAMGLGQITTARPQGAMGFGGGPGSLGFQHGQALMHDYNQLNAAENMRMGMWGQGLGRMGGGLQQFRGGMGRVRSDFRNQTMHLMNQQSHAVRKFLRQGRSDIGQLGKEYGKIIRAGKESAGTIEEQGEYIREQGQDYLADLTERADANLAAFGEREDEAKADWGEWSGKTEGRMEDMLSTAQRGYDEFEESGLAFLASQKRGLDSQLQNTMDSIELSDMDDFEKQAYQKFATDDAAANWQGVAAGSWNQFAVARLQANQGLAAAQDSAAKLSMALTDSSNALNVNLIGAFNQAAAQSDAVVMAGTNIASQMDLESAKLFTQSAMMLYDSQLEATALKKHVTDLRLSLSAQAADWRKQMGQWGFDNEQFLAGMMAKSEALALQGNSNMAAYYQSFAYNPASAGDVIMGGMQAQMTGAQAGIDYGEQGAYQYG